MSDEGKPIAFGCQLTDLPEDEVLRELVWTGVKGGWNCGRTKAGCWHIRIAARKDAMAIIGAEICMPNEAELHRVIDHLEKKSEAETIAFIESLPGIHAAAAAKRSQMIRDQILRP
jgi:hypothetical protein